MAGLGIGQVRVPASLLLRPVPTRGAVSDIAVEDLAPALTRARIRLAIVEVTAEADVPDLIELNVPFAQGNAFAPARPVRGEILAALPVEAPPPPEDDPGPERRSFRSLLRRAG
jgi:cyclic-di-GMP phosphodiesterase TipF (flagellum assembly factor)